MTYLHYSINETEENILCIDNSMLNCVLSIPGIVITCRIDFTIHGKTYQERKASLETLAIEFSNFGDTAGLYGTDMWYINDFFRRNGKRYGLLTDFIENCLC